MRIVQVANFVSDRSGGQRRTLLELGRRYVAAGHSCTLVVPGDRHNLGSEAGVDVIALPGVAVPASGGYRMILRRRPLQRLLTGLGPDVVELSDKTTLAWLPGWLRARGIPTVLLVHERHDELLDGAVPARLLWREVVQAWADRAAATSAAVVCPSHYAAGQFRHTATTPLRVALGVDLETFTLPESAPSSAVGGTTVELVYVGRLSPEKRPDLAIGALVELVRRGVPAHLRVVGAGPLRDSLAAIAHDLPVTFTGRVDDRAELAGIIGAARIAIAPCPVETFGLSILEALACGVPVVASSRGGAPELVTRGVGVLVAPDPERVADGVETLLRGDATSQAAACRAHSAQFSWERTAAAMLDVFGDVRQRAPAARRVA